MESTEVFEQRKLDHLHHALDTRNQAEGRAGLDEVHLMHEALPDLDLNETNIVTQAFGKTLRTPFYVSGMTAGHPQAAQINETLARACEKRGWVFGVGSQRRDLSGEESLDKWPDFRKKFPNLVLVGNLGLSQLAKASQKQIGDMMHQMGADALAIHTNPLQEAIQPEGTPHFKGSFAALESLCINLSLPCVLKETGCGFSRSTLIRAAGLRLAAIDISGMGGTHWGRIEGARAEPKSLHARTSKTFENWGESTVESVIAGREVLPENMSLWASGGVRSGLDAAKLIALGAHRVGYAKPALEAAMAGEKELESWMELQEYELRVALFCTGNQDVNALRNSGACSCEF